MAKALLPPTVFHGIIAQVVAEGARGAALAMEEATTTTAAAGAGGAEAGAAAGTKGRARTWWGSAG
jgi:hypothetical protein